MLTGVGEVLLVLLRAHLGLLEVLVLDFYELDHFGGCEVVFWGKGLIENGCDRQRLRDWGREGAVVSVVVVFGVFGVFGVLR